MAASSLPTLMGRNIVDVTDRGCSSKEAGEAQTAKTVTNMTTLFSKSGYMAVADSQGYMRSSFYGLAMGFVSFMSDSLL